MSTQLTGWIGAVGLGFLLVACSTEKEPLYPVNPPQNAPTGACGPVEPSQNLYDLDLPYFFPEMDIPQNNPLTVEGVELGRHLFWDGILSRTNDISCASCHQPQAGFSDPNVVSVGVDGRTGVRNSMTLANIGYANRFFWDGRSLTLEEQILEPVVHPDEMDLDWPEAVSRLTSHPEYPQMFSAAFGGDCIDSSRVAMAIAQFLRTMVSANSKFDRWQWYGTAQLTPSETRGLELFLAEGGDPAVVPGGQFGGDCFHCHGGDLLFFTNQQFSNNGLDSVFTDLGLGGVTGNPGDMGKFKVPTLRNAEVTGPFMHDGRFADLEEVLEHYNSGGVFSPTIDPFMKYTSGGLQLPEQDKQAIIDFIKTLTDYEFLNNPKFQQPE